MLHRSFSLFVLLFTTALFTSCQEEVAPPTRPNVLFIAIDDLRTELGVYGNSVVKSPHMDKLATEGALFTHHYVQVPTCGASRHALLTGYRPYKPIHLKNNAIEEELSNSVESVVPETFIHRFKQAGYHTVGIGKISHSADGLLYGYEDAVSEKRELPHSWNELLFEYGKWKTGWNAFFAYANGENRQSLKKQVKPYEMAAIEDEGYPDGLTTNLAISKLRDLKNNKKPFFMGVGFFKPHLPFNAPKKYWNLYDPDSICVSPNQEIPAHINLKSLHESAEFNQYALGDEQASLDSPVSDAYAKKLNHAYLAAVSYIDAQVGKLIYELEALGLAKNTIIVIWGDHGWHLGDQRVWGKHTLFENALKSTLIIKSPIQEQQRKKIETIVETVDIYPSLLEMCNIPLNHKIDGESFVELFNGRENTGAVAYSYFNQGISIRTNNYRLTSYTRLETPLVELYDHTVDPLETQNIAHENPELVNDLMTQLQNGNTGLYVSE